MHAVADGTPESVEADLAVMPRRVRESLLRQLAEGERIVIRTRQDPMVLVRYAVWPAAAAIVWWWLVVDVQAAPRLIDIVFLVFAVGLARLAWKEVERRHAWYVVTDKRILKHEGIFSRSVPMMRLTKVTDMTYHRTLLGEIGGYGTIIIESAGQKQAIRDLTYIPNADDVNAALNAVIFGERPRRKKNRDRTWPRIRTPRRRRGDEGDDGPRGGGPREDGPPPPVDPGLGGVDVSSSGHPPMPRSEPESWYRSSNLRAPRSLGDTGEIPVVRAGAAPFDQDAVPRADHAPAGDHGSYDDEDWGSGGDDDAREIPLYPPRDWVDRH